MGSDLTTYYIYSILNIYTNKSYIGKSIHPYQRFKKHLSKLKNNKHENSKLQRSYNKHGKNAFELSILYETKDTNWGKYEIMFIALFNTTNDKCGYNIGKGGESSMVTKEIQEKQKQANKDRVNNILQIDCNYKIINKFESAHQAERRTGFPTTHILDCCHLKSQSCKNYYWCYEKDYNKNWQPPLHGKVHRVVAEIDKNANIIEIYRNIDTNKTTRNVYDKLTKNKDSPICEYKGKYYMFKNPEEYYNFVLNRTCRD